MKRAGQGDRVTISYIGTLDNGHIFDSTQERAPLSFVIGEGEVFSALEQAIVGMVPGQAKNLLIPSAEAYGPRRNENILVLQRESLPAGNDPKPGRKVQLQLADGSELTMRVIQVSATELTLDGNHPLAGLDLTFALRLEAIG